MRLIVNARAPVARDGDQAEPHEIVQRSDLLHLGAHGLQPRAQGAAAIRAQQPRREHAARAPRRRRPSAETWRRAPCTNGSARTTGTRQPPLHRRRFTRVAALVRRHG
jgi:hypothetical protein